MVSHGRGVFSDQVDPVEVAQHWVRKVDRLMRRSIEARAQLGSERFIDVSYYDLLKNPVAEVERIYQAAQIPFSGQARAAVAAVTQKDVQNRYGKHRYNLADFKLTPADIEKTYGYYRRQYGIPHE